MYTILVYDISVEDNGAKRWRRVFKLCKQYLNHVQSSVFEGELTKAQLFELKKKIGLEIDKERDSVLIFTSRDDKWMEKEVVGMEKNDMSNIL